MDQITVTQSLQELYEPFRQLADGIRDVAWLISADFADLIYVNPAYKTVWGCTSSSLFDRPTSWLESVPVDDRERVRQATVGTDEKPFECDYRLSHSDGSLRWIHHRGFPLRDAASHIIGHANIAEDVTDSKQSQIEFTRYFLSSPDLMLIFGFDGRIRRMNTPPNTVRYLSEKDVTSAFMLDFAHPDDRDNLRLNIDKLIREGVTRSFEVRSLMADGSYHWFSWSATAYQDTQLIYAAACDVTDRRFAQDALAERARQQTCVVDLGARALASNDLGKLMDDVSEEIVRVLGVELSSILELQQDSKEFLIQAGAGWKPGVVGHVNVNSGSETLAGFMLSSGHPVIVEDLRTETRFRGAPGLAEYNVIGAMGCMIPGLDRPYGVLDVFSTHKRIFGENDILFIQSVANILAVAIIRQRNADELDGFFSLSVNPMFICGVDGYLKRVNPALEVLSGFSAAELMAQPSQYLLHPDDRGLYSDEVERVLGGKKSHTVEVRLGCKDGSYRWTTWNAAAIKDWCVFYSIGQDTNERHITLATLTERELQIRTLLDTVAEGIFEINTNGICEFSNASCCRMLGYDCSEDLLGKNIRSLVQRSHADGSPFLNTEPGLDQANRDGCEAHVWSEIFSRRDGTTFPVEYWSYPTRRGTEITGCVVSFIDITARKHISEIRDRFFKETPTPMCIIGFDKTLKYLNPGAERLFGFALDEVVGKEMADLIHPDDRELAESNTNLIISGVLISGDYEIRLLCKNGKYKWIAWNSVAFPDRGVYYSIGSDVTSRHVAEQTLADHEREFQLLFDSLAEGVTRMDIDGKCTFVNASGVRMLGYDSPSDIIGKHI